MNRLKRNAIRAVQFPLKIILIVTTLLTLSMAEAAERQHAHKQTMPAQANLQNGQDHQEMSGMMMRTMDGNLSGTGSGDPFAYADGYRYATIPRRPVEADEMNFSKLQADKFEASRSNGAATFAYDLQGWFGRDYDRWVIKAEGDVESGTLKDARTELLWGHAITSFWDTQLGLRNDGGIEKSRNWLTFGLKGLAPYWFDIEATAYVRDAGHTALRLDASYDLLITQKLILQPRLEANWYGKTDEARSLGSGLSNLTTGLRLRYEIRREIAPYIGAEWGQQFGGTAGFARRSGLDVSESRAVAGVRWWF